MTYFSSDKRINDFCNALIRSKRWKCFRGGKHYVFKHKSAIGHRALIVAITPSDSNAFAMLLREYKKFLRAYLIQIGVIIA